MVNFSELAKNVQDKHTSISTKICSKCGQEFTPGRFNPYQKYCKDCGSHGKNKPKSKRSVGGGLITTNCNVCNQQIMIDQSTMTAHCLDHCSQEERHTRVSKMKEKLIDVIENAQQIQIENVQQIQHDPTDAIEYEAKSIIDTIVRFTTDELNEFPLSIEFVYICLLAKGFKLSKSGHLYKEYDGEYSVSISPPGKGFFGFCVGHPVMEFAGNGKKKIKRIYYDMIQSSNSTLIKRLPIDLVRDISALLDSSSAKKKRESK